MIKTNFLCPLALLLAVGCASDAHKSAPLRAPAMIGSAAITRASYQESAEEKQSEFADIANVDSGSTENTKPDSSELLQPSAVDETKNEAALPEPQRLPAIASESVGALTLEALQELAFESNPAIAQQAARICALRGKWVQVGLPTNPTVGYTAGEIGNDGAAGQQGVFVGKNFITAQKLQRNRAIVAAEIHRAEQQLAATQARVRTDVRQSYYGALLAQRRVELAEELVQVTTKAASASKSLLEAEEIPLAGLLQTEIQQQNARVMLRTAENGLDQAWRELSAVVANGQLAFQQLTGDVSALPEALDWQEQLARLQTESPELAIAMAQVERARRALNRACVESVPNISTQVSVQYDDSTSDTITGVQVGIPLPIWDRNQGGIRQAQAEISEAMRNVERIELNLQRRLADTVRQYADARVTAATYENEVLPRSKRTFSLVQRGYEEGEVGYLDLLAAQQTFSQANLSYLDALKSLWQSKNRIDGLLLENSLATVSGE
ncbi:TolC family protein [Adhaeretor mobilis]|uniref:Cobalt-zinc-cadmium resistance protein CzcC n=1 Tax=Adhaeretor mobilis TaxID=1930276 RepID=A0A517MTY5_9BACT|nr:TolC family protein [Adhaeretor mobilis]QDS98349.1 Cobalt-zinc-cadmium resistance protein CzcC precursor [Adhaeretor mobilis]